jgi:hypothetical protein
MGETEGADAHLDGDDLAVRARAMIDANAYMTIASADADGAPWASPVWFAHDQYAAFLWVSRPDARHSRNIDVRREVGLVIFDSTVAEGEADAVYIDAIARAVDDAELQTSLTVYSDRSTRRGGQAWTTADVTGHAAHRLYVARSVELYVLGDHDQRVPVTIT